MFFMVVEDFAAGDRDRPPGDTLKAVGVRFKEKGRMLPDDVSYVASWMEVGGRLCYQLMEAPDRAALEVWISRWSDLVRFEVSEVSTSTQFWRAREAMVEPPKV